MQKILLVAAAILLLAQLVPVDRSLPAVEQEVAAPPLVREILERSCYDCHSHETRWPWYGYVAPVSWLVAYDIAEARKHLNLSAWNRLSEAKRAKAIEEIWEEVEEGEMPLWYYLPLHPEARLSEADREALSAWAASVAGVAGEADEDSHADHEH